MRTSSIATLLLLILAACAGTSQASVIGSTFVPSTVSAGDIFEWKVGVMPENGEQITGFQFDLVFSEFLTPGAVTELGYFSNNGIFFFPGISGAGSLSFVSDALGGGDFLPDAGFEFLFKVAFTATASGAPELTLANPIITLSDFSDATISATLTDVPEPTTMVLTGAAAVAGLLARRLRGSRA